MDGKRASAGSSAAESGKAGKRARGAGGSGGPVVALANVMDEADHRAELARTEDWYDPENADNVVHNFTADVTVDGVNAGSIKAEVINREGLNMNFHEACDEHSEELQLVGTEFCDRQGGLRVEVLDPEAHDGGFMYIADVTIKPEHKEGGATDVTAEAVRLFLTHPKVGGAWSLAVYIPEADRWRDAKPGGHAVGSVGHRAFITAGQKADMRAFFRVGFEQPPGLGNRVYITQNEMLLPASTVRLRFTHAEALAMPVGPLDRQRASARELVQNMNDFRAAMGFQGGGGNEFADDSDDDW